MTTTVDTLLCRKCNRQKPVDQFHRNRQHPTGRHPWCKDCKNARAREHYYANVDEVRAAQAWRNLKHRAGITRAQYEEMFEDQGGACAICGCPPRPGRRFDVDHDHDTGVIRGLLCWSCNLALGYMHDDTQRLAGAIAYLRRWV